MNVADLISQTKAEPRPYQERIVVKAYDGFMEKGMRSTLIESPTGSGKTIMALFIAKAMHEYAKMRIGWVAMRRHLLQQVQHENQAKGFNVPLTYISMFDKEPPTNLDMLIVDEAQHDVTSSMGHIHALIKPKHILGLSATPFRADRVKLCFDSVIKDAGIATLIMDGYLSPYHHYTIPKWGVEEVVHRYVSERDRWGKSIMYFHRLVHCADAQARLTDAGVTSSVVSGSSDTERQIADFYDNKIQVLINCMKLTEGFDCPDLKTVFCRPSCKSVTVQMCGRVLRKHPNHQFKQIVQTEKTPYVFTKTALAQLQHLLVGDEWRTLEINKNIDKISSRCVKALAVAEVSMPEFIKKANAKTGNRRFGRRDQARVERSGLAADTARISQLNEDGSFVNPAQARI